MPEIEMQANILTVLIFIEDPITSLQIFFSFAQRSSAADGLSNIFHVFV